MRGGKVRGGGRRGFGNKRGGFWQTSGEQLAGVDDIVISKIPPKIPNIQNLQYWR